MPQKLIMPIKVDTQKPVVENFNVGKVGDNTVVIFKPTDNVDLSSHFYVDIQRENRKKHITFSNLYVDNFKDDTGEYVINLGNIGDAEVTIMVEDIAGNSIMTSTLDNTDDIKIDTRGESFLEKLEQSADFFHDLAGTSSNKIFKSTLIYKSDLNEDGTYTIKGKLSKSYNKLVINGVEASLNSETGEYEIHVPLTYGINFMKVEKHKAKKKKKNNIDESEDILYVEDMSIDIKNTKKISEGNKEVEVLETNKDVINISGTVKSYFNVSKIVVNGDVIHSSNAISLMNVGHNRIEKDFSGIYNLQNGCNTLNIEVYNVQGHKIEKIISVKKNFK